MRLVLFFLFFVLPLSVLAEEADVVGFVTDEEGNPLVGANILITETGAGGITDSDGRFIIEDLESGSYELLISYIGYARTVKHIEIVQGESKEIEVILEQSMSMPRITVIGASPEQFDRIPGTATAINRQTIDRVQPLSNQEVFRQVSGVHAVEEEGLGLRTNIGVRGLDPSRSRSVLVMEDGVPVALAPYGEPEMYYTPPMDRMEGIEVLKGSGSIKFGPQTFGGVINFITPNPPAESDFEVSLRGGRDEYFKGHLQYGNTVGDAGFNVSALRKQGKEIGILDFGLTDINSKIRFSLSDNSVLGAKFGFYNEISNSTYVGITQTMFETGDYDFTHPAPDDKLDIRRYSGSISHDYYFTPDTRLQTTVYGNTTTRDWSRQDFHNEPREDADYVRTLGKPDAEGGALYFLETTGNRNRTFDVFGIEPRFDSNFELYGINHELDAGARYLFERAYEQRINGTIVNPTTGQIRDDETRTGQAFSAFLQNRSYLTDQLSVTPGFRFEYFDYIRDVKRVGYETVDITNNDVTVEWIPGIGVNYNYAPQSSFFAGVHKGFGPPRVKDAISVGEIEEGEEASETIILQTQELEAERSWNYEIGNRSTLLDGLDVEITGFLMDFSNQVIPVAEAAAGAGKPGGLENAGATRNLGVEAEASIDLGLITRNSLLPVFDFSATYTNARYNDDRFVINDEGEAVNVNGNRLPYSPDFMATASVIQQFPFGLELNLSGNYSGDQYGDPLNRTEGSLDGREGKIDSHYLLDANMRYDLPAVEGLIFTLSVKNLMNERYIASRRPQGIRLGMPRFISGGVDWNF